MNEQRCLGCGKNFKPWDRGERKHGTAAPYLKLLLETFAEAIPGLIPGSSGDGELTLHVFPGNSHHCKTAYAKRYQDGSKWKLCLYPIDHIYVRDLWEAVSLIGPFLSDKAPPKAAPTPKIPTPSKSVRTPSSNDDDKHGIGGFVNDVSVEQQTRALDASDKRNAQQLTKLARRTLKDYLDTSGYIYYSSAATLSHFPIYLMGLNPGGNIETQADEDISAHLKILPRKEINNYLDDSWAGGPAGTSPLQKRVNWLLSELGFNTRDAPASNLIFMRSRDQSGVPFKEYADICWPVNEAAINFVNPKAFLVFGNAELESPFQYLKEKFGISKLHPRVCPVTEKRGYVVKAFWTEGVRLVVGLPHLSHANIIGRHDVIEWIQNLEGWPR